MKAVGLKQADFIGHSMGGFICLWIAAHHPSVVSKLVLVSPAIFSDVQPLTSYFLPLLKAIGELTPRFFPILLYDALRAGPFTLLHEEVKAVDAPTLLVWGANDTLVPAGMGHVLRETMKHARLLVIERAGHVSMFNRPQAFHAAVERISSGC
jgi:pimeloyl-ACP methyl ester carboxylesterase